MTEQDNTAMTPTDSMLLSPAELAILKGLQKGDKDAEVCSAQGLTRHTFAAHLKNIRRKLSVRSRDHAIDRAVAYGLISAHVTNGNDARQPRVKVGIVGCGKGGIAVLHILKENPCIDVIFVSDTNPDAYGVEIAARLNIPFYSDLPPLGEGDIDVLINVTGSEEVADELRKKVPPYTELMGGLSAMLMWQITEERRKRLADKDRVLKEHENLCHLGEIIENIDSMSDAGFAIVEYASKLLGMPAGSLAVCDDAGEEMVLVATRGFSDGFAMDGRWKIRAGGLTDLLLSQSAPTFFADIAELPDPNPLLIAEGVKSVLAAPLIIQRSVVGILYLNDFKRRDVRAEDFSLFSLLAIYAALTVARVKSIEKLWHQSQHDGLTGLLNHRSLMEHMEKEEQLAKRRNGCYSIIMIDIDDFKLYNDNFGHLEGNKVLKSVSRLLMKTARLTDTVGRFGGEEFLILAPDQNKEQIKPFAERLVTVMANYVFPKRQVTISVGVASYQEDGDSAMKLLKYADDRLYQAKKAGKNRVCS
ncbi:hypothetical protein MNBD_GAMMA26-2572 [hydrothermal vent metagenome]|uniref:GGDEF domain-containing protein n=1 Tax=hydrothermal vent metagenome TaxID=652676 RepID=A0A3B1B0M1_9ZZZZ